MIFRGGLVDGRWPTKEWCKCLLPLAKCNPSHRGGHRCIWFAVCIRWLSIQKGYKGIISRKELHTSEISVLHHKVPLSSWSWWLSWLTSRFSSCQAQWEYAARGGLEGMYYPWGDTMWPGFSVWNPYLKTFHPSPVVQGMAMRAKMLADSGRIFPRKRHFCQDMITAYS